ncbi:MAG: hypothetical protein GY854_20115 [Deltaproteobacteria bacterium]|nr:hypothetical protein [Deltaproteobacteria bacterium]
MKRILFWVIAVAIAFSMSSCLIKQATEDMEEAMEDATKTDGDEACEDVMTDIINEADSCVEGGVLEEGKSAMTAAAEYCDQCTYIGRKVEYDDVFDCQDSIGQATCVEQEAAYQGTQVINDCEWMNETLGC